MDEIPAWRGADLLHTAVTYGNYEGNLLILFGSPHWTRIELSRPNWRRVRTCEPGAFQKGRPGASSIIHDGHPAWTRLELTVLALRVLSKRRTSALSYWTASDWYVPLNGPITCAGAATSMITRSAEACCCGLESRHRQAGGQMIEKSRCRGDYRVAVGEAYANNYLFERAVRKAVSNVPHEI